MDHLSSHPSSEWMELKEETPSMCDGINTSTSRFHVAPVDHLVTNGDGDTTMLHESTSPDDLDMDRDHENGNAFSSPVGSFHNRTFGYGNTYDTKNVKSLRHYTRDALPRIDHYRNILSVHGHLARPTLEELVSDHTIMPDGNKNIPTSPIGEAEGAIKFGWIQGVFVRCLLNIWGVMLFIRLSWVVAEAGIGLAFMIIILASIVTTITALSMSAICTNGEVKGGGTYYMISRSLGPEFGGSIGVIFAIANAVAIAMYSVGFAETLQGIFAENNIDLTGSKMNDIRLISCIAVAALLAIALIGTEWESKAQIVLLIILLVAMLDFVVGSVIPPSDEKKVKGFVGWNLKLISDNFGPDFREKDGVKHDFFSVFAVFFPAATGILAGANISGDLKDPQQAIPLGTLLAIGVTTASYLGFAFLTGALVLRDASGALDVLNGTVEFDQMVRLVSNCSGSCKYGAHESMQVIELVSMFGPIIYAGIFAATLSSALASLVSAPKVFQALCKDKLFPYIDYFAKGYGRNNEPRRGFLLAFVIAIACCCIGDLNLIAPIISNFFLAAYFLINFSCFHASFAKSLGFRPSFRYYNMWASLAGAILCLTVMFVMDWAAALITFVIIAGLYIWVLYRKPNVNWGSSTQAQTYRSAIQHVYRLNLLPEHVKNYRPQILLLTGSPYHRPPLIDFAYGITKGSGLLICGHAVRGPMGQKAKNGMTAQANDWLAKRRVKAFYAISEGDTISKAFSTMIGSIGIGRLRPNTVLMGFKNNWQSCDLDELTEYFNIINETFSHHLSIGILRIPGGLDCSRYGRLTDVDTTMLNKSNKGFFNNSFVSVEVLSKSESDTSINGLNPASRGDSSSPDSSPPSSPSPAMDGRLSKSQGLFGISNDPQGNKPDMRIPKEVLNTVNQFSKKQKKGTIDVWWLYDDGGLTMLLPYILSTRSNWSSCKLRVFSLANKKDQLDREQRNMAALLNKFRIDYSNVTVIPDVVKSPKMETRQKFKEMITKFVVTSDHQQQQQDKTQSMDTLNGSIYKDAPSSPHLNKTSSCTTDSSGTTNLNVMGSISESEIVALKDKINRHLRLHELLQENSSEASLVVMTLSMPRKGTVSAPMYMSWLEMLTQNMPPFLLIRGNQSSVLTFYS